MGKKVAKSFKDLKEEIEHDCSHRFYFGKDKEGALVYICVKCHKRFSRKEYTEYNLLANLKKKKDTTTPG